MNERTNERKPRAAQRRYVARPRSRTCPTSIAATERLIAYHEHVLAHARSADRRDRSERALAALRPHMEQLTHEESADRAARYCYPAPAPEPPRSLPDAGGRRSADMEFDVVWNGTLGRQGKSLTSGDIGE